MEGGVERTGNRKEGVERQGQKRWKVERQGIGKGELRDKDRKGGRGS